MRASRLFAALFPFLLFGCTAEPEDSRERYGPENTWFRAAAEDVPAELGRAGTGYEEGDVVENFTFVDQHGDQVELYQFYGKVILLDVFAEWCGPCQENAPEGENIWQTFQDVDVVVVALMQEIASGEQPSSAADPARWADTFELTHPVLADDTYSGEPFVIIGGGYPTYPVLGPDMRVMHSDLYPPSVDSLTEVLTDNGLPVP